MSQFNNPLQLQQLFRSLPMNLVVLDKDTIIVDHTDCMASITMKTREELIGQNLFEAYAINEDAQPEPIRASQEYVRRHKTTHSLPLIRYDMERPEEQGGGFEVRYWQISHHPILDEKGELLYLLLQTEDKTEQRMAELKAKATQQALQETQARDQFILDALPILLWTIKPNGKADYLNKTWLSYTGKSEEELLGWRWVHIVHPEDRDSILNQWKAALDKGKKFQTEYRLQASDGTFRWFQTSGVPRLNELGEIIMWVVSSTDINEHKKKELLAQGAHLYQKSLAAKTISASTLRDPDPEKVPGFNRYFPNSELPNDRAFASH